MTEKEKMESKMWYDASNDKEIVELRMKAEDLCFELNNIRPSETEKRLEKLKELFPYMEENCFILSPIYTDYGFYTKIGHDTFINRNAYLMDGCGITIGSHCFIGPNCGMYTAIHATLLEERNQGIEKALPIVIGDNCWLGGDVTILPGVTIGNNTFRHLKDFGGRKIWMVLTIQTKLHLTGFLLFVCLISFLKLILIGR